MRLYYGIGRIQTNILAITRRLLSARLIDTHSLTIFVEFPIRCCIANNILLSFTLFMINKIYARILIAEEMVTFAHSCIFRGVLSFGFVTEAQC